MYDMHVHSGYSSDCRLDMEKAVLCAIQKGLSGIAFTDHLDIDYTDHENEFQYDFNDYFGRIDLLRRKYSTEIDILSGVEIGVQPHVIAETKARIKDFDFDFIIGSTHLIKRRDPYYGSYFSDGVSKVDAYGEYLDELFGNLMLYYSDLSDDDKPFCAMGHFDYIVRYAHFDDSRFLYSDHADKVDDIFRFIIERDIALEINTSTYLRQPLDLRMLTRYKELGGRLITLGSDAHSDDRLGVNFRKYADCVRSCGFDRLYYYKDMTPLPYDI